MEQTTGIMHTIKTLPMWAKITVPAIVVALAGYGFTQQEAKSADKASTVAAAQAPAPIAVGPYGEPLYYGPNGYDSYGYGHGYGNGRGHGRGHGNGRMNTSFSFGGNFDGDARSDVDGRGYGNGNGRNGGWYY